MKGSHSFGDNYGGVQGVNKIGNMAVHNYPTTAHKKDSIKPIKILFIYSDPIDSAHLGLAREIRDVKQELLMAPFRDRFNIVESGSARPRDMTRDMLREKPDIVHFSGHGTLDGELCFEDDAGNVKPVEAQALAMLFQSRPETKCVILNSCYSAAQAEVITKHVGFVVGMKKSIFDDTAKSFAVGFYQSLGSGEDFKQAFNNGCTAIAMEICSEESLIPKIISRHNI